MSKANDNPTYCGWIDPPDESDIAKVEDYVSRYRASHGDPGCSDDDSWDFINAHLESTDDARQD